MIDIFIYIERDLKERRQTWSKRLFIGDIFAYQSTCFVQISLFVTSFTFS